MNATRWSHTLAAFAVVYLEPLIITSMQPYSTDDTRGALLVRILEPWHRAMSDAESLSVAIPLSVRNVIHLVVLAHVLHRLSLRWTLVVYWWSLWTNVLAGTAPLESPVTQAPAAEWCLSPVLATVHTSVAPRLLLCYVGCGWAWRRYEDSLCAVMALSAGLTLDALYTLALHQLSPLPLLVTAVGALVVYRNTVPSPSVNLSANGNARDAPTGHRALKADDAVFTIPVETGDGDSDDDVLGGASPTADSTD